MRFTGRASSMRTGLGFLAAVGTISANAANSTKPCYGLPEDRRLADASIELRTPLAMSENECESMKMQELRLELLEIPQDKEDPISLSIGVKNHKGVMLRLKIPFSF